MSQNSELEQRRARLSNSKKQLLENWKFQDQTINYTIPVSHQKPEGIVSPAQKRLWFMDQLVVDRSSYNMYSAVRLHGTIDQSIVQASFRYIAQRHSQLRCNFLERQGEPYIINHLHGLVNTPCYNLTHLDKNAGVIESERLLNDLISTPFNLEKDPLFRPLFISLHEKEHIIAVCMHHIISDGWSMGILLKEWTIVYNALLAGREPRLVELPIQYADFAYWQTQKLEDHAWDHHLEYWKQRLNESTSPTLLPDKRYSDSTQQPGAEVRFQLPILLCEQLDDYRIHSGSTLFALLFTVFNILLHRYTGETNMLTGTPIANRNYTEIEGIIGYFVNLLPLSIHIEPDITFQQLLNHVMQSSAEAFLHQDFPFDRLIEELQPERSDQAIPLIRHLFVFQNQAMPNLQITNAQMEVIELYNRTSKTDILLSMAGGKDGITARLEYNSDLYLPATIERLAEHFIILTQAVMESPTLPIQQLNLLCASEEERLSLKAPIIQQPSTATTLHKQFEQTVMTFPERTAIQGITAVWNYKELNEYANQIAHYLLERGVLRGQFIALYMDRSPTMIASLIAILKVGCAYVPIDAAYPQERIQFMLEDAQCTMIIVDDKTIDQLPILENVVLNMDQSQHQVKQCSKENLHLNIDSDQLAYMIYTSGSTGKPKGVLIEHQNVSRLFRSTAPLFQFDEHDVWTLFHSCAFDFSVWEIWGALLYGGRLVVVPAESTRSFEDFYQLLIDQKVTVLNQTPSAFKQLIHIEQLLHVDQENKHLNTLRYVIFGGEALELESLRPWIDRYGDDSPQLINMYGITEITVHATYRRITMNDLQEGSGSLIGVPLPDMSAFVLDSLQQPVPIGVVGELYIGGPGVSRGYWQREELNQLRFSQYVGGISAIDDNPFRVYRSGDLARWTAFGELEYIGRIDDQVKVRGYRIELGEIEAAIQQYPLVSQNVTIIEHNDLGDPKIACYLIPHENYTEQLIQEMRQEEQIANRWVTVFDGYYMADNDHIDKTFHTVGWNDSYQGEAIPAEQMEEWTNATVQRIQKYQPKRILEIGCGTGLLLFRLATTCEAYTGIDFSSQAIQYIEQHLSILGEDAAKVQLHQASADELDKIPLEPVDMVIINSVAQYFSDLDYLNKVLTQATSRLRPGGTIFLGDVCGIMFTEPFQASIVKQSVEGEMSVVDFQQLVQHKIHQHNELMLGLSYFKNIKASIPAIQHTDLLYKKGQYHHEMNKFRFDAILHTGQPQLWEPVADYDWSEVSSLSQNYSDDFAHLLYLSEKHDEHSFVIRNIPNARLQEEWNFMKWYHMAHPATLLSSYSSTIHPSQIIDPYKAEASWINDRHDLEWLVTSSAEQGCMDAIFYPKGIQKQYPVINQSLNSEEQEVSTTASIPLRSTLEGYLGKQIRSSLKGRLPTYMIPSEFVILDRFPLTVNGKIEYSQLKRLKPQRVLSDLSMQEKESGTPTEEALRLIWLQLLDIEYVSLNESFFDVGGHSLLVAQLMFYIKKEFDVHIPLLQLMQEPTIRSIAFIIDEALAGVWTEQTLDLKADIHLEDEIQAHQLPYVKITHSVILLTGATGFYGAFLLNELLQHTDATIYCLVRAEHIEQAQQKIENTLHKYELYTSSVTERIVAVPGDLALTHLGIEATMYKYLCENVTAIYHNGATVNFAQSYRSLYQANVGGSIEILKMASTHTRKAVHFVSTLYVFSSEDAKQQQTMQEHDVPVHYEQLQLGYTQSKWVSEGLMHEARLRGIPVNIYRLGRISGHSVSGACQENDFFWKMIRFCIQIGAFPDIDFPFNLIPADTASHSLVALSQQVNNQLKNELETSGYNYHLLSPSDYRFREVTTELAKKGFEFTLLAWSEWKQLATQLLDDGNTIQADITILPFVEEMAVADQLPQFATEFTRQALQHEATPISNDNELLEKYINYFVAKGYFHTLVQSDKG